MKLPIISNTNYDSPAPRYTSGFTLLEVLISMALVMVIGGLGIYFGIDHLRGYSFHGDRDTLISALQHARAQSVANICQGSCSSSTPHGVAIQSNKFIIFQGTNYSTANHTLDVPIDASTNITHGGLSEIIFKQLSGDSSTTGNIVLTDTANGRTSTIFITSEGQILWSN